MEAGAGGRVLIKSSSPSLDSLLNTGSSLEAQQFVHPLRIDPTLNVASVATVNPCTVLLRASDLTTHRSMIMQVVARGSLLYGGETPTYQMKEPCCHSMETIYVGARDVLPDQARGTISWRCFKNVQDDI